MKVTKQIFKVALCILSGGLFFIMGCQTSGVVESLAAVDFWLTTPTKTALFEPQKPLSWGAANPNLPTISIHTAEKYQVMDGFGLTLTGGSAEVINQKLTAQQKTELLKELFSAENRGIGISYLRISIGASDLSAYSFTYNDLPAGQTDTAILNFSIDMEKKDLIPILKQILAINPNIKILGSPWSPPTWMKSNKSFIGGKLLPSYYSSYAQYLVKYIHAMKKEGIPIEAITIQNEPENPKNEPSLDMTAEEQKDFIKNHLGPAFKKESIGTKIVIFDHNCDHPEYPLSILQDSEAKKYIDGSAFHLYAGEPEAMTKVHEAHPDKNIYFTEQWTSAKGQFGGDVAWATKNLTIGATRNWAKTVLQWNLATDENWGPHTPGGCTECLGALTIGKDIQRNPSYYIMAHASKFVRPQSVRIGSDKVQGLPNVAFLTPDNKHVLIVLNDSANPQSFNIKKDNKTVTANLAGNAVGTFVF